MRKLVLGGILLILGATAAGAADLGYRYGTPAPAYQPGAPEGPAPAYEDDEDQDEDGAERPQWREQPEWRPHGRDWQPRPQEWGPRSQGGDCWLRPTPWGRERVCR